MAVISLKTNLKNAANVKIKSVMFGLPCEVIEAVDPNAIYMDLCGTEAKAVRVAQLTGAEIVAIVDRVENFSLKA